MWCIKQITPCVLKLMFFRAATKILGTDSTVRTEYKGDSIKFLETYRPEHRLIIVRNPWARLLSAYQDKIVTMKYNLKVK